MSEIVVRFGVRLRECRQARGLSQEELATKAGLNRTYVSKIEQGKRTVSIKVAAGLAEALDVDLKELFEF